LIRVDILVRSRSSLQGFDSKNKPQGFLRLVF
jgi:hypothetical protein